MISVVSMLSGASAMLGLLGCDSPGRSSQQGLLQDEGTAEPMPDSAGCDCDDGLACSMDLCVDSRCLHEPIIDCAWPSYAIQSLVPADPDGDLQIGLSAAAFDPIRRQLWTVRSAEGASAIWRLAPGPGEGASDWTLAEAQGGPAEWKDLPYDLEGITVADPVRQPDLVHVLAEDLGDVVALDLSRSGVAAEIDRWDLSPFLPTLESLGPEAITYVPEEVLLEDDFVDGQGHGWKRGFGGLFLVGHQNGGRVYAFSLGNGGAVDLVGQYLTARSETSGLELDPLTGRLYLWHGATNDLEVARLSSVEVGEPFRKLVTEYVFSHPSEENLEGMAVSSEPCVDGRRSLFLVAENAGLASAEAYLDWPLCR